MLMETQFVLCQEVKVKIARRTKEIQKGEGEKDGRNHIGRTDEYGQKEERAKGIDKKNRHNIRN